MALFSPLARAWGCLKLGEYRYRLVKKDGGQAGFTTLLDMIPERKLGIICFINESPPLQSREQAGTVTIMRLVLQHLLPVITHATGEKQD